MIAHCIKPHALQFVPHVRISSAIDEIAAISFIKMNAF
jgi:hypothetical protein